MDRVAELKRQAAMKEVSSKHMLYTKDELEVLRESSTINGKLFVPFIPDDVKRELYEFDKPFTDPDGKLQLSEKQRSLFGSWVRASKLLGRNPQMIVSVSPQSILQEFVADCSFVSSLCIAAHHERRFKKKLITNLIYPQVDGTAVFNPCGKYMVKLWYNGVARCVVVDDRFPMTANGDWLCSFSKIPNELWVSVIEKAYMKLNGGFDFPGSVSGIDLYSLTGWIPEVHVLSGSTFTNDQKESTWSKLHSAAGHGDVLMTVATGTLSDARADALGLVPTHAYAVLEVCESQGKRLLQLKNPWSRLRWKGNFSPYDEKNWTPALRNDLNYDLQRARENDTGIFWIDYDSLLEYFGSLYLNWNPKLFETNLVVHKKWNLVDGAPKDDSIMVGSNPQYNLEVKVEDRENKGVVWILLSRHVIDKRQVLSEDKGDFLTLNVYDRKHGKRVYYPEKALVRGTYSNNPHSLITFEVPPGVHKYTLVVSLYEKTRAVNYTLSVYASVHCLNPVLRAIPETLAYTEKIIGDWEEHSAGGCPRHPTFQNNPQYTISFEKDCKFFHMRLLAYRESPVNIRVFNKAKDPNCQPSCSRRVDCADPKIQVGNSMQYRKGFCILEQLEHGETFKAGVEYTIVVSCFEPDVLGRFFLHLEASVKFKVKPIPTEGEGMFLQSLRGEWADHSETAAGCPNYGNYYKNPSFIVTIVEPLDHIIARIQTASIQGEWPSLNLSLYESNLGTSLPPSASIGQAAATSNTGIYMNAPSGAVIEKRDLPAGQYLLIPSTFKPQNATFEIKLFTSQNVQVVQKRGIPVATPLVDGQMAPFNPTRTYL
mmetsp:Transcript_17511/g.38275  ORF Transcript_17511/g.38275 Transcript_17511/m.38275 type:complete len:823 (-) Transcript_17511:4358-6826(-)